MCVFNYLAMQHYLASANDMTIAEFVIMCKCNALHSAHEKNVPIHFDMYSLKTFSAILDKVLHRV